MPKRVALVTIISVKPSLARWNLVDKTRATNALLRQLAGSDPRLSYADVFTPMIGPDEKPIPGHFVEDGLHLTPAAIEEMRSRLPQVAEETVGAIIEEVLLHVMYDVPSREDIAKVVVTAEVVNDNVNPTLVPREPEAKKKKSA